MSQEHPFANRLAGAITRFLNGFINGAASGAIILEILRLCSHKNGSEDLPFWGPVALVSLLFALVAIFDDDL